MFRVLIFVAFVSCKSETQTSSSKKDEIVRRYSNISQPHTLLVDFNSKNDQSIKEVRINSGKVNKSDDFHLIKVYPVLGGGVSNSEGTVTNDVHGDSYIGRIKVKCDKDSLLHRFSVNQILSWQTKYVDNDSVYIAPKICE